MKKIVLTGVIIMAACCLSLSACSSNVAVDMPKETIVADATTEDDNSFNIRINVKGITMETEEATIDTVPTESTSEDVAFSVVVTDENLLVQEITPTEKQTQTSTEKTTEETHTEEAQTTPISEEASGNGIHFPEGWRFGTTTKDTTVTVKSSRNETRIIASDKNVVILQETAAAYLIKWYDKTAILDKNAVKLSDENFVPDFSKEEWVGVDSASVTSKRYGICTTDTTVITPTSIETLYKGQKVKITEIGDTTYVIEWYGTKAFAKSEDIQIFDEGYEPDFASGSWAGCITSSPVQSYFNTERYGICVKDTIIVTPDSNETLFKSQRVHILEIGDDTYVIQWDHTKAFAKSEDIQIFDEGYEPNFTSGSWAGCITD